MARILALRDNRTTMVAATAVSIAGLVFASAGAMYVASLFGLSITFASQIINAVQVGGWVLAIVMAAISGGIAAVVVATARWAITRWGAYYAAI